MFERDMSRLPHSLQDIADAFTRYFDPNDPHALCPSKQAAGKLISVLKDALVLPSGTTRDLSHMLARLEAGVYALPRTHEPAKWDHFEVVYRTESRRPPYVAMVEGGKRMYLPPALQLGVARVIAKDSIAAQKAAQIN